LILQALRGGAHEFLTAPVVLEELLQAMQRLQQKHGSREGGSSNGVPKVNSLVVAMLGSRGGVGATSLGVNLGCCMAADKQHNVALLDLDLALGDADVALDLMPVYTLADVAMNIVRLDMTFLKRSLVQHEGTGLSLLPHPVQLQDIELIKESTFSGGRPFEGQRVAPGARSQQEFQCARSGRHENGRRRFARCPTRIEQSAKRWRIMARLGVEDGLIEKNQDRDEPSRLRFLRRSHRPQKGRGDDWTPVFWQVPNEPKAMMSSRNAGIPLILHAPRSKTHQSINGLAQVLLGTASENEVKKRKNGFFSFA